MNIEDELNTLNPEEAKVIKGVKEKLGNKGYMPIGLVDRSLPPDFIHPYHLEMSRYNEFFDIGLRVQTEASGLQVLLGVSLKLDKDIEEFLGHYDRTGLTFCGSGKLRASNFSYAVQPVQCMEDRGYYVLQFYSNGSTPEQKVIPQKDISSIVGAIVEVHQHAIETFSVVRRF